MPRIIDISDMVLPNYNTTQNDRRLSYRGDLSAARVDGRGGGRTLLSVSPHLQDGEPSL